MSSFVDRPAHRAQPGFTLVELLVVLAVVALLLSVSVPRYIAHVDRAREAVLRENLRQVRLALDRFQGDLGRPPRDLAELVTLRYLRALPVDPLTERADTWTLVPTVPPAPAGLDDLHSGAPGVALDGTAYASW